MSVPGHSRDACQSAKHDGMPAIAAGHPYGLKAYAAAFASTATPLCLPASGTWVLERAIPGHDGADVAGCHPRTPLADHASLTADLDFLAARGDVSAVFAVDVFTHPGLDVLEKMFDIARPFKTHYLRAPAPTLALGSHHRYMVKRARQACEVAFVPLTGHLDTWCALYATLADRRGISGAQAFSRTYFECLATLPGLATACAFDRGTPVAMHLWFEYQDKLYSHLAAASERGYALSAPYAIHAFVCEHYRDRMIDLGGSAGNTDDPGGGLARFKRGFASSECPSFLCGKVLDARRYAAMAPPASAGSYFPAYRAPP